MTVAAAADAPLCLPPHPPSAPVWRLPAGACDCHMHVFGPREAYPLAGLRSYTPQILTIGDYRQVMGALGIARAVLVQPSVYGPDNSALLDALATAPADLRGVVVVAASIADEELARMHGLGVRGIRINRRNPGGLGFEAIESLGRRIAPLGWHIQLQIELASAAADLEALLRAAPVPLVIDHLGLPDTAAGVGSPAFRTLLRLLPEGQIWVKLSAPYRISRLGPPYADVAPFVEALIETRPDRLLWASDWPHTELFDAMPHDAALIETSLLWRAPRELQNMIFVANPARLYWAEGAST